MREHAVIKALRMAFDVSRGRAKYSTIRERIDAGARIDGIHLCQLIAAMIIASVGLNINSTEAVIGAMLICPLMGSVMAMAYGIAVMDRQRFRHALAGMLLQCGLCLVTSTLYFAFSPLEMETSELLTNSTGTVWDVIVALVGGFAGALGLSRRQEPATLISGVAVATALMPPLCAVGYGLAANKALLAVSALYNFLVNVFFIAFGATLVLAWLRVPMNQDLNGDGVVSKEERDEAERETRIMRHRLLVALVVFAMPCLYFSWETVKQSIVEHGTALEVTDSYDTADVTRELKVICPGFVAYRVGIEDSYNMQTGLVEENTVATVVTSESLKDREKKTIEALIRIHVVDLDAVSFELDEA